MKKIDLFSLSFYEFGCNDHLTDKILSLVKGNVWKNNIANQITTHDLFYDTKLFQWFDDCILSVKESIGFPNNIDLPITSCWANKTTKLQSHHAHNHSNSFLSGIFYLTGHESAPTVFTYPNPWFDRFNNYKLKTPLTKMQHKIYPKKSTLILFPSQIMHSVPIVKDNIERYTISFNTYLNGELDNGDTRSRLTLKTKSVREIVNET